MDGDSATFGGGVFYAVDFGAAYNVSVIRADIRVCKCLLEDALHVQWSSDGATWQTFMRPQFYAWGTHVER
eukprot:15430425-Alexandrium_andersonii.AAC.1